MEIPLSFEETLAALDELNFSKHGEHLEKLFVDAARRNKALADNSLNGAAKELEVFCREEDNRKLLKMYGESVPAGILPTEYKAVLHDIKVSGHGPDDKVYQKNPLIRMKIPRGTTTMELTGPESWHDVVVYANKKFTGGIGDEDDSQNTDDELWREYFLLPPEENTEQIVSMEKLNGDAVHFSGRYINGKFYLFAGSKNTHMLLRRKSDIDLYQGDRYGVAKRFAKSVCDTMAKLDSRAQHVLYSFLHHTKATAVCEVLQPEYQHIVDLSYLEENEVNFITFTPTVNESETTLTAFPPHFTLKLMSALGLAVAPYTIIQPGNIMEQRERIRTKMHSEGQVMYFLNKEGDTIGIAKAKSIWYICLRALREKIVYSFVTAKKKPGWNYEDRVNSMKKRYTEIQKWLKLSNECVQGWKDIGAAFMKWVDAETKKGLDTKSLRPQFPQIWKNFLEATGSDDNIPQ